MPSLGIGMKKFEKSIIVYITGEIDAWLEKKASYGYKKAALVRHIIENYMKREAERYGSKQ